MSSETNSIKKYLVPVRVRVEYNVNPDSNKLERVCYVECRNGELLTNNIPFDWAHFITSAINTKYHYENVGRHFISSAIAVIRIDGMPLSKGESRIVGKNKDGVLTILDSPEYIESFKLASLQGEDLFLERWTRLPINEPIEVSCIYNVTSVKPFNLSLSNAWVMDLLVNLGIIKNSGSNIVKSTNGSEFRRVAKDPHTLITIRRWEGKNNGQHR